MAKFRAAALLGAVNKVKDYARKNPEKTSDAIGKVEGFVRGKAGPQHSDKVGKGGDALRKGLGVPSSGASGTGGTVSGGPTSGGGSTPPPPPPSTGTSRPDGDTPTSGA
ncbi:antitoxin [Phycicoccus sp. BSK3Z-2]|uniref:Antitoxin n=1 Tax=Phycicoccus avicenniae TaxID=2828860 RepID=A0A941D9F0_9MICO|nr:antitoxin [Phycicoccus avicenniae]MBR7743523.1 antitoxin [Phycicoccus avicenniae]